MALGVSTGVVLAGAVPAAAQEAQDVRPVNYVWPVAGTVIDPFRPPSHPYGPGNRGLEIATQPGSFYRAAADGVVSFAGPVGGRLHVTVTHPDGLRVLYSGVASIRVERGARVGQGAVLGTTADRLHVGVRRGEVYVDPAAVFGDDGWATAGHQGSAARLVPAGVSVYRLRLRWLHSGAGIAAL